MDQALHMHMVPAADVAALRAFYIDALGWKTLGPDMPGSVMLRAGTAVIVFLPRDYLAKESGIDVSATARAINAVFVESKADVDSQIARALAAGAALTSPVRDRDGGLYSGYFTDPEGNGWEIVWSPVMRPGADGGLTLALP
ncbi:VOC family protein [Novosphingobium sp. NDB2Meth1]|uniref:VOC family protein n=1 Tax=Novosphingobium sp. NDB2Meth1 TaxID=1892847 RepID=UPI00092FE397|nr:VOC family protein [Novosphingobium sp. NDB2Meth1]